MCGDNSILSELDESNRSYVKFRDGSTIFVMGKGNIQIQIQFGLIVFESFLTILVFNFFWSFLKTFLIV